MHADVGEDKGIGGEGEDKGNQVAGGNRARRDNRMADADMQPAVAGRQVPQQG